MVAGVILVCVQVVSVKAEVVFFLWTIPGNGRGSLLFHPGRTEGLHSIAHLHLHVWGGQGVEEKGRSSQ